MTPQDAFNLIGAVLRDKTTMTGGEHELAKSALKALADGLNTLVQKNQALEAKLAEYAPVADEAPALDAVNA